MTVTVDRSQRMLFCIGCLFPEKCANENTKKRVRFPILDGSIARALTADNARASGTILRVSYFTVT
jgi:hypothetical protein